MSTGKKAIGAKPETGNGVFSRQTPRTTCPTPVITGNEYICPGSEMTHALAEEIAYGDNPILKLMRHAALAKNGEAMNRPHRRILDNRDPGS